MDLGIKGKRAVVTGGGRGIGRAIAYNLAKEGARVAVISRTESDLVSLVKQIGGKRKGHYYIVSDLTKPGSPKKVYNELQDRFGEIEILVNNLGDSLYIKDPYCCLDDWQKLYRINLEVTIELNNLVIPSMKEKKWGRIVNISSIASLENQGPAPFCSMKAALTAYSRSMGRILAKDGIIMVAVLPGAVFTKNGYWDITSKTNPEHVKKYLNERMAIKRFGTLDEVGTVVAFFCSQYASFCVGSAIVVDGGQGISFQQ